MLPLYKGEGLGQVLRTDLVSHDNGDKQMIGEDEREKIRNDVV